MLMRHTAWSLLLLDSRCSAVQHENIYVGTGRSLNVAYLYGAYEDSKNVMLVMELCKGGEMWNRVRSGRYSEKVPHAMCLCNQSPGLSLSKHVPDVHKSSCAAPLSCYYFACKQRFLVSTQEADRFRTLDCSTQSMHPAM